MRWVRVLLIALGLVLGSLIVIFGANIGVSALWLRIGIAIALLLPVPIMLLFGLRQRRATRAALTRSSKPSVPPELKAQLEGKLQQLEKVLEASKLAGDPALFRVPRVLMIGPPGAGKSAAIHRARLELAFTTDPEGGSTQLEISLSRQGAIFDLPGAYFADDGVEHAAWLELLSLLAARKKPVPVDAVVAVIALDELASATPDDAEALALRLRRRTHEVFDALGWRAPLYLMFSRADRVAGFVDSFSVLPSAERAQALGVFMESDDPQRIRPAVDGLLSQLRAGAVARLPYLEPAFRAGTFALPEQLAALAPPMEALLRRLYEPSPLGDRARVAGAYLASAAQDRAPIDPAGERVRRAFGLSGRPDSAAAPGARSFFLHELFARLLLLGSRTTERSAAGRRRHRRTVVASLAVSLGAAALIGGFSLISYSKNSALIASTVTLARSLQRPDTELSPSDYERLHAIVPVAARLEDLERWEVSDRPLSLRFGFYSGGDLLVPLRLAFERPMQELFVDRVGIELESMLGDATGSGDVATDYDVLKAYLMLTREKARLDRDFVVPVLVDVWRRRLDGSAASETDLLKTLARTYVDEVARDAVRWPTPSDTLIQDARASLRRRDAEYLRMVASAKKLAGKPLSLTEICGGKVPDALRAGRDVESPLHPRRLAQGPRQLRGQPRGRGGLGAGRLRQQRGDGREGEGAVPRALLRRVAALPPGALNPRRPLAPRRARRPRRAHHQALESSSCSSAA